MSLPDPKRGGGPKPKPRKLSSKIHAAILDDGAVRRGSRVVSVRMLERATDPQVEFSVICNGETLAGPTLVPAAEPERFGKAITTERFTLMIANGWTGGKPLPPTEAEEIVRKLRLVLTSNPASAMRVFELLLAPSAPPTAIPRIVSWYFYCDVPDGDPLALVTDDLALRLALPCAQQRARSGLGPEDYVVMALDSASVVSPRTPRFVDQWRLEDLEIWRPGGRTVPWVAGLDGLPEAVSVPTTLSSTVIGYSIWRCK